MTVGYSPKLPLYIDSNDGFCKLNKTLKEVIQQNIKMIVLTSPGERMMNPSFGVGVRDYLFSAEQVAFLNLKNKILEQVGKYLPIVQIKNINVLDVNADDVTSDTQSLGIRIIYNIPSLGISENLEITLAA